jgi:hypothetical protein
VVRDGRVVKELRRGAHLLRSSRISTRSAVWKENEVEASGSGATGGGRLAVDAFDMDLGRGAAMRGGERWMYAAVWWLEARRSES